MKKRSVLSLGLLVCGIFAGLMFTALPASGLELEQGPDGYIVRLASGESVVDAWRAIEAAREQTGAWGVQDVIELGEGIHPMNNSYGSYLTHYWSGPGSSPYVPLVIRGTGSSTSHLRCMNVFNESACAVSHEGLTLEDLAILNASQGPAPIIRTVTADLTLRRVRLVDQNIELESYMGAIDVFRGSLTIEDSVLSGNQVDGGHGLILFQSWKSWQRFTLMRSTIAGNTANAMLKITCVTAGCVEIEQATLVENTADFIFHGNFDDGVSVSRSILDETTTHEVELTLSDSFTETDPQLANDGSGVMVPRITSPVIDALPCDGHPFDQRGEPTGVRASYFVPRGTACDYGAVEAQHSFCMATAQGTVACEDGQIPFSQVALLDCRLVAGLLDCSGGQEIELSFLDFGEEVTQANAQLIMQFDGNLVLYEDGAATWATATNLGPCVGHYAEVQDGELKVFSDPDAPGGVQLCWASGLAGDRVVLRESFLRGMTQIVTELADGTMTNVFPYQNVPNAPSLTPYGSKFQPDDLLAIDGAIAVMQLDGNFVLYEIEDDVWTPTWATGTYGVCAGREAYFQPDGNLVIGAPGTPCLWAMAPGPWGTVLRLHRTSQGTAALTLYTAEGEALWTAP